jgi:hypothetical protein
MRTFPQAMVMTKGWGFPKYYQGWRSRFFFGNIVNMLVLWPLDMEIFCNTINGRGGWPFCSSISIIIYMVKTLSFQMTLLFGCNTKLPKFVAFAMFQRWPWCMVTTWVFFGDNFHCGCSLMGACNGKQWKFHAFIVTRCEIICAWSMPYCPPKEPFSPNKT